MKQQAFSCLEVTLGGLIAIALLSGFYTFVMLNIAALGGTYKTPEIGIRSTLDQYYSPDRQVRILYAGTNSFDGSNPHIWYVIYEVRASSRTDGLPLSKNGCDSGGRFFLDTKKGWVPVSEGMFPQFMGYWMRVFGTAGPGQATPSTNWAPDQPDHYCSEPVAAGQK